MVEATAGDLMRAVADGQLTPSEAQAVSALVENFRRTLKTEDHERRLVALEQSGPA